MVSSREYSRKVGEVSKSTELSVTDSEIWPHDQSVIRVPQEGKAPPALLEIRYAWGTISV